jgi:hypothetical protein
VESDRALQSLQPGKIRNSGRRWLPASSPCRSCRSRSGVWRKSPRPRCTHGHCRTHPGRARGPYGRKPAPHRSTFRDATSHLLGRRDPRTTARRPFRRRPSGTRTCPEPICSNPTPCRGSAPRDRYNRPARSCNCKTWFPCWRPPSPERPPSPQGPQLGRTGQRTTSPNVG